MSKLLDPHICPDCRADLDHDATCTGCGLRLTGPTAQHLWQTMRTADGLVEALRRQSVAAPVAVAMPAPTPLPVPLPVAAASRTAGLPVAPPVPPVAAAPGRLPASSVPTVLFGTGALCLLIAAVVFVAVAWGSLGLGAKTTILLAVTAGFGALATRLTRRGLRGGAETFWTVTGVLVTIDLVSAYGAGLLGFDRLDLRFAVAVLGAALAALGVGAALLARRTDLEMLVTATLASTGGVLLATGSLAWAAPAPAVPVALSVLVLAAVARALTRSGLVPAAYGVLGVTTMSWVVLVLEGLNRAELVSTTAWWTGSGWPLVVAALFAGGVAGQGRLPEGLRTTAATGSVLTLVLVVLAPGYAPDAQLVVASLTTVVLAGVSLVLPRAWALPAAGFAALGLTGASLFLIVRPLLAINALPATAPGDGDLSLRLEPSEFGIAAWTAIVVAAVVAAGSLAAVRWIDDPAYRAPAMRTWVVVGPTVLALGIATAVLETEPTLLVAFVAWNAVLAVLAVLALAFRGAEAVSVMLVAGYLGVAGIVLAAPAHLLVALAATALALGIAAGCRITLAGVGERAVLAAVATGCAGLAVTQWAYVAGGHGDAAGIALVVLAVVSALAAVRVTRSEAERVAIEVVALAAGLVAVALPLDDELRIALLTVTGTAIALVAVVHRDRDQVGWLGTVVLGAAALARIDLGLELPELATAPAAALLLAAGAYRLFRDAEVSSIRALGSGLTLALLPTLLLALEEPISTRSVVVGVAAVLALSIGIERRWAAPFLAGAGVLAVLAVRHLGPVAEAVPRWISFGLLGVALLAIAVTWESRRRDLQAAERYLVGLR